MTPTTISKQEKRARERILQMWVEMIQEDESLTLLYFNSYDGFQQAIKTNGRNVYMEFFAWLQDSEFIQVSEYDEPEENTGTFTSNLFIDKN